LKKVIALKGTPNTGNPQTIRTVHELLLGKFPDARVERERGTRGQLCVVLSIDGVRIGIDSHGAPNRIKESLDLFVSLGCEIIICATRTRGETVTALKNLAAYEVLWLEQRAQSDPIESLFSKLAMARNIVKETEESITSTKPAVLSRAAGR
jgi:hypothetical protein